MQISSDLPITAPDKGADKGPNAVINIACGGPDIRIGNDLPVAFIAGPCAMENRDHALFMADQLQKVSQSLGCQLIYKTSYDKANRTSISGYRGLGIEAAMRVFEDIKAQTGLAVLTDVHTEAQCAIAGDVVDVLQIPAYLCRQTDLLLAAAKTGRAINVKKGQFLAPWDMKHVIEKIVFAGNRNVMACERGVSFGYNTLITDMRALVQMRDIGCPIVFDATHSVQQPGGRGAASGGQRDMVPVLAAGASAIGVAAVFMEVHQDPDNAPSDGPNMVHLDQFESLIRKIMAHDALAKQFAREDA